MNRFRPLVLVAATLLFISACSTPEDLTAPTLEPQFGTAAEERGLDVVVSDGRAFVLSEETAFYYDEYDPWYSYGYDNLDLRLYDTSGNLISSAFVNGVECGDAYGYGSCGGDRLEPRGLYADSKGFRYVLYSISDDTYVNYYVTKLNTSGSKFTYSLGRGSYYPDGSLLSAAVDSSGNIYVAKVEYAHNYDTGSGTYTNVVAKYSTTGALQWQRTSTVGTPYGITVSSSGSVYVVGTTGLARYTNSGGLTWSKAASNSKGILEDAGNLVISGSYVYTRSGKDIRKYDSTGRQLWLRTQSGLNTLVVKDVTGDSSGNIYVSGKYLVSTGNANAFIRKINASGTPLWTKTYGTSAYDDARDAATVSGSEIYVTGETQGSLAHTNTGGRDGYIRKLNSSGNPIWTR